MNKLFKQVHDIYLFKQLSHMIVFNVFLKEIY